MGSAELSGGVRILTRARAAGVVAVLLALMGRGTVASGAMSVDKSRAELLYSQESDPDCSMLSMLPDDQLPQHVVRLRAVVDGVAPEQVRYRWSVPKPGLGSLAADLDLGPADQTAAIRGMCAEFGNSCLLSADKLPFYSQPTVLWLAPTCSVLPDKTDRNYPGRQVRVRVQAFAGKRKLGSATAVVGFGRSASITLYIDGQDGVGKPFGIPSDIQPFFSTRTNAGGGTLPTLDTIEFQNGAGDTTAPTPPQPCTFSGEDYEACANSLLYRQAGRAIAVATAKFDDGSALCDNVAVRVLSANIIPKLDVSVSPRRASYVPGDARRGVADLRVRLVNASPRAGGGSILLAGNGVLTCAAEVKVGGATATSTTVFDLQHCSETTTQPCTSDTHCRPPRCPGCGANEFCLLSSHCSDTLTQPCGSDVDCEAPRCTGCQDDESCVQVLEVPQIVIPVGRSVDLVTKTAFLANTLATPARVTETWTVSTFNAGSDSAALRYRIVGRPAGTVGARR